MVLWSLSLRLCTFSDSCLPTCYLFHSHIITFHIVYMNSPAQCLLTQKLQTNKQRERQGFPHPSTSTARVWALRTLSTASCTKPFPSAFLLSIGLQHSILLKLHYYTDILIPWALICSPAPADIHFLTTFRLSLNSHTTQVEKIPVSAEGRCLGFVGHTVTVRGSAPVAVQ